MSAAEQMTINAQQAAIAADNAVLRGEGDGTYSEAEDAIRLLIAASAWRLIESWQGQPTGQAHPVIVCVSDGGLHDPVVGEAWFDPDAYGGTWWWANMSQGDYHASPIDELQHGTVTHWIPMFMAPIGTERKT